MLDFISTEEPANEFVDSLRKNLKASNVARGLPSEPLKLFRIMAMEAGSVIGGIEAESHKGWMRIATIYVDAAHQKRGIGSSLLRMAEAEACKRKCIGVRVLTSTIEAPGFYERNSYEKAGEIKDCPERGLSLMWYVKRLDQQLNS